MTTTSNLSLPFLEAGQAQKHVTHNEALRMLDALVMLTVLDRDLSVPPPAPQDGARYIVRAPGSGAFAGKDNQIAHFADGGWLFHPPRAGWTCFVADDSALLVFAGAEWVPAIDALGGASEIQNLTRLGFGTEADAGHPFAAKLNTALWTARTEAEGGDGDLRHTLSKEASAHTLSLLMQSGSSKCAEIGLTGDDDLHVKVSPDGSAWLDAMLFDRASGAAKISAGFFLTGDVSPAQITADQNDYNPPGLAGASVLRLSANSVRNITGLSGGGDGRVLALINAGAQPIVLNNENAGSGAGNRFALAADVTLPARQSAMLWYDGVSGRWKMLSGPVAAGGGGREVLTGNRTYYVRADGSDANDGLSNSAAGAFLTIQKAVDVIAATLDIAGHNVTVQVGDGTYGGAVTLKNVVGFAAAGNLTIQGNATTPANVLISTATHNFSATGLFTIWDIRDLKIANSAGNGLRAMGSCLRFANVDFGACAAQHISAQDDGVVEAIGDYAVSGGSTIHFGSGTRGVFRANGRTVTFSNSPAFSNAFILVSIGQGLARVDAMTFVNGGTVSGKRYSVLSSGVIFTNGAGATYLPGDVLGTEVSGGQYI